MRLYTDKEAGGSFSGWYLILDNDFLSELYKDEEIFSDFLDKFRNSYLILDPFTEFEFLRDVFDPKQRSVKEKFIAKSIFISVANSQETYLQLQENAVLLSRIYSQKGHNRSAKISLVDLFLAARCMLDATSCMIVTGNKRDFPNSIFDVVVVMNIEQNDGNMKPYSVVRFSKHKFTNCYESMVEMEQKFASNEKESDYINILRQTKEK